ncbi:MAG TPA: transglutaminaseTgpA domain-containing protein, partial [Desulfomonilia bacterium]|nr:transglutaminaseTgpA domain-containing protein [Desulfomonilia bacterium]
MHRLSTSERLKLLTLATSLAGILCMSLADLLPLSAFIFFAALHAAIGKWFYENEMISQKTALAMIVLIFVIEAPVVVSRGSSAVVLSLRDMILAIAVIRLVMRKTPREIYQIVGISFAQCLLATIFTISPLFLPGVSLMALLIPMTLYTLDAEAFSGPGQSGAKGSLHWLRITMGIILTACLLFYLLPRPTSSIIQHGFAHRKTIEYKEDVNLRKTAPDETGNDVMMRVVWSTGKAPSQFYLSGSRLEGITPDGF